MKFLELEAAYLVIGVFILIITAIVTTRSFVGKNAFKIGFTGVFIFLSICILLHYFITTNRMEEVKNRFNENNPVICENKIERKIEQSIIITKELGWKLEGDIFVNPQYIRGFHTARCISYYDKKHPKP
jgi:energy-coupling factor transporter transmembrane protein EcfT